jgi:hypothetical protein
VADLVERVARAIYLKSLERSGWKPGAESEDDRWRTAKIHLARDPVMYERPRHAFEDARIAIGTVLEAIAEPTEAQMQAASSLSCAGDKPLKQWYRAMIAALKKELEGG